MPKQSRVSKYCLVDSMTTHCPTIMDLVPISPTLVDLDLDLLPDPYIQDNPYILADRHIKANPDNLYTPADNGLSKRRNAVPRRHWTYSTRPSKSTTLQMLLLFCVPDPRATGQTRNICTSRSWSSTRTLS